MRINKRRKLCIISFAVINLFLIENMSKAYELGWVNDKIRLICYALLGILSFMFEFLYLIRHSGRVKQNSIGMAMSIYFLIMCSMLLLHSNMASDIWLVCTMIPFSLLISYFELSDNCKLEKIVNLQCMLFVLYWILFMYNKLFLHQAGAGKLNSIFYLVLQLPFILSLSNIRWKRVLVGLIAIAVVISLKRTAMVIFLLALIIYLWIKNPDDRGKLIKIIATLFLIGVITIIIQNEFNVDIIGKFETMANDGGSGRIEIYDLLLPKIFTRGLSSFIFGDGYYGVVKIVGGTAHNDFLEIFFDFGLIGFIAYINIYVVLLKNYLRMNKNKYPYRSQYLVSILTFIIMSSLSHVIMIPSYMMFICLYWGMVSTHFYNYLLKEETTIENRNVNIS